VNLAPWLVLWRLSGSPSGGGSAQPTPEHTFAPSYSDLGRISPQRSGSAGAAQMSLIAELKRRNVFRVGVALGITRWDLQLDALATQQNSPRENSRY
jgi:hypothetical protein